MKVVGEHCFRLFELGGLTPNCLMDLRIKLVNVFTKSIRIAFEYLPLSAPEE